MLIGTKLRHSVTGEIWELLGESGERLRCRHPERGIVNLKRQFMRKEAGNHLPVKVRVKLSKGLDRSQPVLEATIDGVTRFALIWKDAHPVWGGATLKVGQYKVVRE